LEKLNKSGRILVKYREEFKKHYAEKVDTDLKAAISILYKDRTISERIFRNIFNEDISDDTFEGMLLKCKEFAKNQNELNCEFDKIRKKVNEYMIEINFINGMSTKNALDSNKIIIIHEFDLNKSFMTAFFGVNQNEIIPLMKRRGFIEKFSVLRLNQVLKEIFNEITPIEDVDHGYSLVYYNRETKGFSIDYKYNVNIELLNNDDKMQEIIKNIQKIDLLVTEMFRKKIGEKYLINQNGLNHKQQPIVVVNEKPTDIKDPTTLIPAIKDKHDENKPEKKENNVDQNVSNQPHIVNQNPINQVQKNQEVNPIVEQKQDVKNDDKRKPFVQNDKPAPQNNVKPYNQSARRDPNFKRPGNGEQQSKPNDKGNQRQTPAQHDNNSQHPNNNYQQKPKPPIKPNPNSRINDANKGFKEKPEPIPEPKEPEAETEIDEIDTSTISLSIPDEDNLL
jgi:hypothetical protein